MKIIAWLKSLFKNDQAEIVENYKKLVAVLEQKLSEKKEVFTFICPPSDNNKGQYLSTLSSFFNNPHVKWFFYDIERTMIIKLKQPDSPTEFCKGGLSMLDVIMATLADLDRESKKLIESKQNG